MMTSDEFTVIFKHDRRRRQIYKFFYKNIYIAWYVCHYLTSSCWKLLEHYKKNDSQSRDLTKRKHPGTHLLWYIMHLSINVPILRLLI
ncbi:hypothetical protein QVD17_05704 [Tagetes erecta]|uniref:Uncharacterized protein n=1 Tax=Tagetes erecta TaxID=13708 RepID=A0AAD8LCH8_TARER|nr:hypothetical protein QVD17_05704 [Tagetes erecta]